jgi:hypothetical protein
MRTCLSLSVALAMAAGTLSAQATTTNVFGISPNSTDATSRSGVGGPSLGDVLIEVRGVSWENPLNANGNTGADYIGVGDLGNTPSVPATGNGRCNGFQVVLQDQNAATVENFDFCIVQEAPLPNIGNPAAPPIGNPNGPEVILRTASLQSPPGTGTLAWIITATLTTPADLIPSGLVSATSGGGNSSWYYGCGLSGNPAWSTDGLSIHMSSYYGLGAPFPNAGDNPRDGVVSVQQARDVTNGTVVAKSATPRTKEIFILTEGTIFNHGAAVAAAAQIGPDPTFGAAGSYPDACGSAISRVASFPTYPGRAGVGDGYAIRIRSAGDIGVPVQLGLAAGFPGGVGTISGFNGLQIYLPFFNGGYVISFVSIFFPVGAVPASGEINLTLLAPSALQPLCQPTPLRMSGQPAVLTPGSLKFGNGASASY